MNIIMRENFPHNRFRGGALLSLDSRVHAL
nr:MAG TPA: hypothetical protein [Caudoviricetes sp.]